MSARKLGLAMVGPAGEPTAKASELAKEAEALGYSTIWIPEVSGAGAFSMLAAQALNTSRIELATGVLPIQIRTPVTLGMEFLTLNELSGGRVVAGLGVSSPVIVERWHGAAYRRPLTAMRECVQILRELFTEGRSRFEGKIYRCDVRLTMRLRQTRRPRIFIAALNPPMLKLAGEIADGVLLNYSPPEVMAERIAAVREGAVNTGRDPEDVETSIYVRICINDDERAALSAAKRELATYAFVDAYDRMLSQYGLGEEIAEVRRLWQQGKRDQAPEAIRDESIRRVVTCGSADFCRDRLAKFRAAGITHPVVFPIGPDIKQDFEATMRTMADG